MSCQGGRVVVLGSLNTDIFARVERHPQPGETILGKGGESRPGGKGANQAVAAALAGADTRMVGAVGSDEHAETALSGLRRAGVDISRVSHRDVPTGLALITVSTDGENTIIVIPGANESLSAADLAPLDDLTERDILVLQGEIPVATVAHAARQTPARVLLNLAPVVQVPADVLRQADPLVVNEHEAAGALQILGLETGDAPEAIAEALQSAGVRSVIVTLGGQGSLVAGDTMTRVHAQQVDVVDTTGAGDAFVGVLAAGLAHELSLSEAAGRASRFAAASVTAHGAQDSYPDWRA